MIFTASWRTIARATRFGPLPFTPVRTSRGVPKYIGGSGSFPAVDELMPDGWMLGIKDSEKFDRCYRRKLHANFTRMRQELDELAEGDVDLVLCCFEADPAQCHRSLAANVIGGHTGEHVPEFAWLTGPRGNVALVHEVPVNDRKESDGLQPS